MLLLCQVPVNTFPHPSVTNPECHSEVRLTPAAAFRSYFLALRWSSDSFFVAETPELKGTERMNWCGQMRWAGMDACGGGIRTIMPLCAADW